MKPAKTLIVVATAFEKKGILEQLATIPSTIEFLIAGIGIAKTTFNLTRYITTKNVDRVINVGIAGKYNTELKIGDVLEITEDCFADFGTETKNGFLSAVEANFVTEKELQKSTLNLNTGLQLIKGATVNMVSGTQHSANLIQKKFNAHIESMEGAAVFMVCNELNIPVAQIRSISNLAGDRNKDNWNIPLALSNLGKALNNIISQLQ